MTKQLYYLHSEFLVNFSFYLLNIHFTESKLWIGVYLHFFFFCRILAVGEKQSSPLDNSFLKDKSIEIGIYEEYKARTPERCPPCVWRVFCHENIFLNLWMCYAHLCGIYMPFIDGSVTISSVCKTSLVTRGS